MKVGETEQEDFLQAFCKTSIHSIFNAISVCPSLCHSAKPHIILGGSQVKAGVEKIGLFEFTHIAPP